MIHGILLVNRNLKQQQKLRQASNAHLQFRRSIKHEQKEKWKTNWKMKNKQKNIHVIDKLTRVHIEDREPAKLEQHSNRTPQANQKITTDISFSNSKM